MPFKFVSYLDREMRLIQQGATKQRRRAAAHMRKEIRKEARAHRMTGEYLKGIYSKNAPNTAFVGVKAPHAYLVEFGSTPRHKTKTGQSVGSMPALGIVYGVFTREAAVAEQIMSEPYVK